jgi:hypothetical protein
VAAHFCCRVLVFPVVLHTYGLSVGVLPWWRALATLPWPCKAGSALLLLPQLYWGALMFNGMAHFLRRRPTLHKSSHTE